jgi:hypothetical protein
MLPACAEVPQCKCFLFVVPNDKYLPWEYCRNATGLFLPEQTGVQQTKSASQCMPRRHNYRL